MHNSLVCVNLMDMKPQKFKELLPSKLDRASLQQSTKPWEAKVDS